MKPEDFYYFITTFQFNYFVKFCFKDLNRSSRQEVFCKKGVLVNFTKFSGKHLRQSLFLIKLQTSGLKFSQNIFTSFSLLYISKLYNFLDLKLLFYLLVDNQVTEFFKEFGNGYFCIELSITLSSNHLVCYFFVKQLLFL